MMHLYYCIIRYNNNNTLDLILIPHYQAILRKFLVSYIILFLPLIVLIMVSHVSNTDYLILVVWEN